MSIADNIRNNIIEELQTISNTEFYLLDTKKLKLGKKDNFVKLTETQLMMLNMSEDDIKNKRLVPHDEAEKADLDWLQNL